MMNLAYDLHIHSCLSPCGDGDMTPANIAGMAALKGLDIVALTDHNTDVYKRQSLGFGAGMGLPNMKKYSDSMDIDTRIGEGTTITMVVNL